MAITEIGLPVRHYIGATGDTKPTTAPDGTAMPVGSTFLDNASPAHLWVYTGSTWQDLGTVTVVALPLYR